MENKDIIYSDEDDNRIRSIPDPATLPPRVPGGVLTEKSYGTMDARETGAEDTELAQRENPLAKVRPGRDEAR